MNTIKTIVILLGFMISSSTAYCNEPTLDYDDNLHNQIITIAPEKDPSLKEMQKTIFEEPQVNSFISGYAPESDNPAMLKYSADGSKIYIVHTYTGNISVMDPITKEITDVIKVGDSPYEIALTDDYGIVPCTLSGDIYIIDLSDNSIAATIAANGEPTTVRVSNDGSKAFVGCNTTPETNDECVVIDLDNLTKTNTIFNFPVRVVLKSWGFTNNRVNYEYSGFEITNDGEHIVAGDCDSYVNFYNIETGAIDYFLEAPTVKNVCKSGDGKKIIAISESDVYSIDGDSHSITSHVSLNGEKMIYSHSGVANYDGSKVFLALQNNKSCFANFTTNSINVISSTGSPNWVATNYDYSLVISGQYKLSVLDFETENLLGQKSGLKTQKGAISPIENKLAATYFIMYEGLYFYDFTNSSSIDITDMVPSGISPEGDAPTRVIMTDDGSKALVINELSFNMSIYDLINNTLATSVNFNDSPKAIALTSDSRYAVIGTYYNNKIYIFDIINNVFVKDLTLNSHPVNIEISSDDSKAYALTAYSGSVAVIDLDGENSSLITQVDCDGISFTSYGYGRYSQFVLSPDDNTLLVCASTKKKLRVFDTATNTFIKDIDTDTLPFLLEINDSGDYAATSHPSAGEYSIFHIDGINSELITTKTYGEYPFHIRYNKIADEFGIGIFGSYSQSTGAELININPLSGEINSSTSYSEYGHLRQVEFDKFGEAIVMSATTIHRGDKTIQLPGETKHFSHNDATNKTVVIMITDEISVIDWNTDKIEDLKPLPENSILAQNYPNPFNPTTEINYTLSLAGEVKILIHNNKGELVQSLVNKKLTKGNHSVSFNGSNLNSGVYFYSLLKDGKNISTKKMILMK